MDHAARATPGVSYAERGRVGHVHEQDPGPPDRTDRATAPRGWIVDEHPEAGRSRRPEVVEAQGDGWRFRRRNRSGSVRMAKSACVTGDGARSVADGLHATSTGTGTSWGPPRAGADSG
jgi:hypothetical protein